MKVTIYLRRATHHNEVVDLGLISLTKFEGKLKQLWTRLGTLFWAELERGGKTYRKAKPREDGPLKPIFGDPPKMVSEDVTEGNSEISKGLNVRNGIGGGAICQNVLR